MDKFRLNAHVAEILRYIVTHKNTVDMHEYNAETEQEEIKQNEVTVKLPIFTDQELQAVTENLETQNIDYEVETLDTSEYEFIDGVCSSPSGFMPSQRSHIVVAPFFI